MLAFITLKPGATHESLVAQLQPLIDRYAQQDPTNFPQGKKVFMNAPIGTLSMRPAYTPGIDTVPPFLQAIITCRRAVGRRSI
jgi:hypothetical protein